MVELYFKIFSADYAEEDSELSVKPELSSPLHQHTDRHTNTTDRHTGMHTDRHTNTTDRHTDRHTGRRWRHIDLRTEELDVVEYDLGEISSQPGTKCSLV